MKNYQKPRKSNRTRIIRLVPSIGLLIFMFLSYGCNYPASTQIDADKSHGIDKFDAIINSVFEANGFLDADRFSNKLVRENGQRHYVVNYLFPTQNDINHWIVAISVAKSGEYINPAEYDAIQKTLQRPSNEKLGKRYMDVDLINIPTSFAPRGLFSGMVFTTPDDTYDIRILLSDMLSDNATPPNFDHDAAARMILELYTKKF
jgi:hypothetical protein